LDRHRNGEPQAEGREAGQQVQRDLDRQRQLRFIDADVDTHTLKGEVGNFGARAAFQAALKVEMLGRSGNLEGIEPAWAALEAEVQRLLPALTALTAS
jgi:HPt (histidine-containing phosphotransfer) domain-containing protein